MSFANSGVGKAFFYCMRATIGEPEYHVWLGAKWVPCICYRKTKKFYLKIKDTPREWLMFCIVYLRLLIALGMVLPFPSVISGLIFQL